MFCQYTQSRINCYNTQTRINLLNTRSRMKPAAELWNQELTNFLCDAKSGIANGRFASHRGCSNSVPLRTGTERIALLGVSAPWDADVRYRGLMGKRLPAAHARAAGLMWCWN